MIHNLSDVITKGNHPHDDYEEPLKLCYLFLRGNFADNHKFSFTVPEAYHQARSMAKVIYATKIVLHVFEEQLNFSNSIITSLKQVAVFVSLIYI